MNKPYQIANQSKVIFIQTFNGLYEHSPWVVENCFNKVLADSKYDDVATFHQLLCSVMLGAERTLQMALILAHPRLAGKKAQQDELTDFSTAEQKSAGLTYCSEEELNHITQLNEKYHQKFGFDFIMAVKGRSKEEIFRMFEQRLNYAKEQEIQTALEQINQIAWLRLKTLYAFD